MKKTTSEKLSKRLTQYGTLSLAIAGIANANGQTSVEVTISGSTPPFSYDLDMGGDSTPEFRFRQLSNYAFVVGLQSYASVLGESASGIAYPFALGTSNDISVGQNSWFPNGAYQVLNYNSCYASATHPTYSNWCGVTNGYLGVRFKIGADTHYGWIRLDVPLAAQDGVTIHDFYYNPNPDEKIQPGQVLGFKENIFSKTKIIALHKTIALYNLTNPIDYKLYSMTGQAVLEGKTNQNTYVIEANTVASGLYVLEVRDHNSGAMLKKKVLL